MAQFKQKKSILCEHLSCMVEVRKSCGIAVVPGLCTGHVAFLETLSEPLCSQFWHCGISSVKKKQKNNFAFTAFWYRGKQAINTICTSCFGFAKTWPVFSGKGSYFCLKEIIRVLGQFLSVTQSILNLISLGICSSPWPQTEFLCLAVHEMSTFIREQALREM